LAARPGSTSSSPGGDCSKGPDIVFPFIVGVTPGVSEDDADEEDVSWLEENSNEFFTVPGGISFLAIVFGVIPESPLGSRMEEAAESVDRLGSMSSRNLDSWDDLGVVDFSTKRSPLGDSDLVMLMPGSFLETEFEMDLAVSVSTSGLVVSDCEPLLEVLVFLLLGTSWSRNFSGVDWILPLGV
jgi:hypothetical protein